MRHYTRDEKLKAVQLYIKYDIFYTAKDSVPIIPRIVWFCTVHPFYPFKQFNSFHCPVSIHYKFSLFHTVK